MFTLLKNVSPNFNWKYYIPTIYVIYTVNPIFRNEINEHWLWPNNKKRRIVKCFCLKICLSLSCNITVHLPYFNWIFRKGELHVPPEIHWHLRSAPPTCNYTTLVRSQGSAPLLWSIPPAHSVWCVLHTQGPPERSFSCSQSRPKADHIAHWFRSVFYLSFAKLNQNWRFIMPSR